MSRIQKLFVGSLLAKSWSELPEMIRAKVSLLYPNAVLDWNNITRSTRLRIMRKSIDTDNERRRGYLTREVRTYILRRDKKCVYCGSLDFLEVGHILTVSKGGSDYEENLVAACRRCNRKKFNRSVEEFTKSSKIVQK